MWVRQLTLSFGISIYAVSAVLSAFMFGLCIGASWIGRMADRIRNPLRAYGYCELAIAAYAGVLYFGLADLLPVLLKLGHAWLPSGSTMTNVARFSIAFVLLLVPTTLMGGTLPLLARALLDLREQTGKHIGRLYGINTLGAVLGTGVAGFWLLQSLGLFGTTVVAIAVNVAIASLALWISGRTPIQRAVVVDPEPAPIAPRAGAIRAGWIEFVIFLSGFSALSYEIIWNRTLLLYVHNSTYAFSMILIVFLLGVSLGSLVYSRLPARWTTIYALGGLQILLGTYVWFSVDLTGRLPQILQNVTDVLGTSEWHSALATMGVAAFIIIFFPTFLMGMTFPMATALCSADTRLLGSRIGNAYGFVTFGNILGSLITGFVLIEAIGLRNAFAVAIGFNFLGGFLLVFYKRGSAWRIGAGLACTACALAAVLWTVDREIFRRFYEAKYPKILFYREEVTDTVMVIEQPNGNRAIRYSDGRGTAGTGTEPVNRIYGHVPMLLHPDPRSVLSICFGVGNTLSALAQHRPDRLVCVELSPGVIHAARYFPSNHNVLDTPNLDLRIEDGRNYLLTSDEHFDVIQLEPPEIHTAAVVNLYTREFYALARDHMTEDGVLCQWLNVIMMPEKEMKMLLRTFAEAFPNGSVWSGGEWWDMLLIASKNPIHFTPEELQARFDRPLVHADLRRIGVESPVDLLSLHMLGPHELAQYVESVKPISDDWTYVDFSVPQSVEAGFGLFVYQTLQFAPTANNSKRIIEHTRLMARRTSPAYMIDFSHSSEPDKARYIGELDSALEKRREDNRERLRKMGASEAE